MRASPIILALAFLLSPAAPGARAAERIRPQAAEEESRQASEVVAEFGWAAPKGDLGEDFSGSDLGFGAGDGLEMGFRWRLHLSRRLSLAPSFHFIDYANHEGFLEDGTDYRIQNSTYRWAVELLVMSGGPADKVRLCAALGAGLYRNRVQGFYKTFEQPLDASVNTFGASGRVGVNVYELEFSLIYHWNRFSTWQFFRTGVDQEYSWDNVGVRAGWSIPFGKKNDRRRRR